MTEIEDSASYNNFRYSEKEQSNEQDTTLRSEVEKALSRYFAHVEDAPVTDIHKMVMSEVEEPLLKAVMRQAGNNQSKASIMLGMNRGTLRTKLKQYGLL